MPSVHHLNYVLCDRAAAPAGEALPDLEIGFRLLEKIEERAAARGMSGVHRSPAARRASSSGLVDALTPERARCATRRSASTRAIRDNAVYGILPKGTTLETLREKGFVRCTKLGHRAATASRRPRPSQPDEIHNPLRWHTEDKMPYDTLVRRAQFYIDHEWFLEAGGGAADAQGAAVAGRPERRFR